MIQALMGYMFTKIRCKRAAILKFPVPKLFDIIPEKDISSQGIRLVLFFLLRKQTELF